MDASEAPFLKRLRYMATISWTRRICSTFSAFVFLLLLFCFLLRMRDGRMDARCELDASISDRDDIDFSKAIGCACTLFTLEVTSTSFL